MAQRASAMDTSEPMGGESPGSRSSKSDGCAVMMFLDCVLTQLRRLKIK